MAVQVRRQPVCTGWQKRAVYSAAVIHGTLWLVIGDCYATGGGKGPTQQPNRMPQPGLKPKDLVGIPWRVAFALQDDSWWPRRDDVWHKPNPIFDHHAIKEPFADGRMGCDGGKVASQRNRGGRSDGYRRDE